jgi:CRISPR-associated protein Cmr4
MMHTQFYLLRAITNLHVGSGETSYGLIDKLIERDAATGFPCINSSGLKGAIKQKFKGHTDLKVVFGSDDERNTKNDEALKKEAKENKTGEDPKAVQGSCNFLPAHLLALPVRSDKTPFLLATSKGLIDGFLSLWKDILGDHPDRAELQKVKDHECKASSPYQNADLGQVASTSSATALPNGDPDNLEAKLKSLLGTTHPIVILSDAHMIELCNDFNLPVIARNALEDGQSQNLWYEQVLPRESLMYFPVIWDNAQRMTHFDLTKGILQVGGNASVGYGFTKISKI